LINFVHGTIKDLRASEFEDFSLIMQESQSILLFRREGLLFRANYIYFLFDSDKTGRKICLRENAYETVIDNNSRNDKAKSKLFL